MVVIHKLAASLAFLGAVAAHPGEPIDEVRRELAAHAAARPIARRANNACAGNPTMQALKARSVERRAATAETLRAKRGATGKPMVTKRDQDDLEAWMTISHNDTTSGFDLSTSPETIFDSNSTCTLVPEVTIGPYWVEGELIRSDVTDDEPGVPLHLDMQFVDLATCEPITDMLIDIWACNSTGVYSGVAATGQGGLDSTYLRGVQSTDADGVVQFDTVFPGHYTGRANHIHLLSTLGATILDNGTYVADGVATHIGQIFFDQDLISAVEATSPYTDNTQKLTVNEDDGIDAQQATADYDPFLAYVALGADLSTDGLLGYMTVFVNSTADYTSSAQAAAHYYAGGGVATGNQGGGGGGFGGGRPPPSRVV
ncbi:Intradiol ring-cleavage dioxygenase [Xylariaceae sp. FL0804]|nr:Intradiol ring-cleavage dioxygenase [Xylariaceae sp. FL0804]